MARYSVNYRTTVVKIENAELATLREFGVQLINLTFSCMSLSITLLIIYTLKSITARSLVQYLLLGESHLESNSGPHN